MTIRNLDYLFKPRSVALLGASEQPATPGSVLARNLAIGGFAGDLFLISTESCMIQGRPTYRHPGRLPHAPDLAILTGALADAPKLITELGQLGTRATMLTAVSDPAEAVAQRQALLHAAQPHLLRLIGPDSRGLLLPGCGLNASLSHVQPLCGRLAVIAQSGAMLMALLDWAQARQIGFSHLLDLGDMVDVDVGDVLDYLTREPDTQAVLLCLEWLTQARTFMSAARAAARAKPVIVLLAGQSDDAVFDAAFRRAGMLRVRDLGELFGAVETLALGQPVYGDRLVILTNGSGIGALAVDTLHQEGGQLAKLAPATVETLRRLLPACWSPGNPVDLSDDAPGERYGVALRVVLQDPGVDAVLLLYSPTALVAADAVASTVATAVIQHRERTGQTPCVFTAWLGASSMPSARQLLTGHGVPCYATPDGAVRALLNRVRYRRNQETLMETPPAISRAFTPAPAVARDVVTAALADGRSRLTDVEAEQVLSAYQIPVVVTRTAADPDQAAAVAAELGGSVALKIQAAGLRHKSDVGGVALSLETPAVVRENAAALWQRIRATHPEVEPSGFTVQPMIRRPQALELAAGVRNDPLFGPVLWFGQGGPLASLIDDRAFALPPLNLHLAQELMTHTRLYRLLAGGNHLPAVDRAVLALTLVKLSQLLIDVPELVQLELDPLLADSSGVLVLGAHIELVAGQAPAVTRLAIRPYPHELEETLTLADGRQFQLRPIRPEDEPAMHTAFSRLTPEEIRLRFLFYMRTLTHAAAARYTQIDYDREMALVLVRQSELGETELYGVVRLVADPDQERAEFAIIIGSVLTGQGLGPLLLRRIFDYARRQGIREVYGEVLRENQAMLKLCEVFGFSSEPVPGDPGLVRVVLKL